MSLTGTITRKLFAAGMLLLASFALAQPPSTAAVASAHPLATDAGLTILNQGGNAFDAAVTVGAVLAVVEPAGSGMGGGGFWLLHNQLNNNYVFLDGRETAPGNAHKDMFLAANGEVDRDLAINTPLSAAIPGQAAAFVLLAEKYGRLSLSESLAPAIRIAEEGFPVGQRYRTMMAWRATALNRYPAARDTFLQNGEVPRSGFILKQPDLAHTLRLLAKKGHAGFYEGELAEKLVQAVQQDGGIWELEDLANYQVVEREPLIGSFRGAKIITSPPSSSGGVALLQTFAILERFNKGEIAPDLLPHLTVEALRRAYYDRGLHLGDSDYVDVPVDYLLSKRHIRNLARSIDVGAPTNSDSLGPKTELRQGENTTHYSILDKDGNKVAATLSINLPFGSGYVAPGTGFLLNNEMDDFSAKPGSPNAYGLIGSTANAIEPGKRPLSSMTPTFMEWDEQVAILGTPGGSRIITMILLGMQEALAGRPVEHWVSRPRFHHQYLPDVVEAEPTFFGSAQAQALQDKGHTLEKTSRRYGDMQAIHWHMGTGKVTAASDPRGEGSARVE